MSELSEYDRDHALSEGFVLRAPFGFLVGIFHIVFFFVLFLLYNSIHIFSLTCVFLLLLFPLSFLIFLVLLLGSNVRSGFELLLHKFYLIFIFYLDWILHVIRMYLMEA